MLKWTSHSLECNKSAAIDNCLFSSFWYLLKILSESGVKKTLFTWVTRTLYWIIHLLQSCWLKLTWWVGVDVAEFSRLKVRILLIWFDAGFYWKENVTRSLIILWCHQNDNWLKHFLYVCSPTSLSMSSALGNFSAMAIHPKWEGVTWSKILITGSGENEVLTCVFLL